MVKPLAGMSRTLIWVLAVTAAVVAPPLRPGSAAEVGPASDRPASVHAVLNDAIECYRRGEYERAARFLLQAQSNQGDLSPDEANDLNNHLRLNNMALKARRTGSEQVRLADQALRAGRTQEAGNLLKAVNANQYLAPADKLLAQQLSARLRTGQAGSATTGPKLDPKALLTSARTALEHGDLDGAEKLTAEAEKAAAAQHTTWTSWLHPWSDTPVKVRKDLQVARAKKLAAQAPPAPQRTPSASTAQANPAKQTTTQEVKKEESSSPFQSIKKLFGRSDPAPAAGKTTAQGEDRKPAGDSVRTVSVNTSRKEPLPQQPAVPAATTDTTVAARNLLKQGRKALQGGNLTLAQQDAEKARDLKPDLNWWEDTPQKLLADVRRVESAKAAQPAGKGDSKTSTAQAVKVPGDQAPDARALLSRARVQFAKGNLDEAEKLGQQAATVPKTHWGLFEDSPDKLHVDIQKTRTRRDRDEAGRVLTEARKLFAKGQLKEAKSKAFLAQKLHGPYSIWDLGDRPQKLISEIETVEFNARKTHLPVVPPASALVKDTHPDSKPPVVAEDAPAAQAREWLAEARSQLTRGNTQVAAYYVKKLEKLNAGGDAGSRGPQPWSADLVSLRHDLEQASAVVPVSNKVIEGPDKAEAAAPSVNQDLARQQARMLLAEARALQNQGRLLEARQKAVEAQKTNTVFSPDEDRPEMVMVQLSGQCDKRIAQLLQQASECVAVVGTDPAQMRKAEACLHQAKELSTAFGLDTLPVDNKIAALQQTRATLVAKGLLPAETDSEGVVKAAVVQPSKALDVSAAKQQGLALLDKARLELRSGQTAQARRLAVEAFKPTYEVQPEAERVLRSIDVEEFNQDVLACQRAFDAGNAAFNRRDFAHAARIFESLDVRKLSNDRSARLREVMMTPEMQPSALALKDNHRAGVAQVADATGGKTEPILPNEPTPLGKAQATDLAQGNEPASEDGLLARAAAMQEVQFQQLHERGRKAQRDAMAAFRAGDTARALDILMDFSNSLNEADLEPNKVALLRRPLEDRLQKLRTLKAQREFERDQVAKGDTFNDIQRRKHLMERQKQERVTELMKQYHAFYKEGKYSDAEMTAQKALELDPDNVAADAAVHIARLHKRTKIYHDINSQKEQYALDALNDTDKVGPSVIDNPLHVDPEFAARTRKRRKDYSNGFWSGTHSAKERDIERKLSTPVRLNFKDSSLSDAIDYLRDISGVNVVADRAALNEAGVGLDRPLTLQVENVSLKSALNLLLQQIHLTYVIKDEVLQITTEENARGKLKRVTYPVADLVIPVDNHTPANASNINNFLNQKLDGGNPYNSGPPGVVPFTGPFSMSGGTAVSAPSSGYVPSPPGMPAPYVAPRAPGQSIEDLLIKLITSTISPNSWTEVGGQGTIQYFPLGLALVINQTQDLQEQIADLLQALRRLQDLEVSLEMRLISVSESFFERIGLDFNINIVNKNHKFDNNLQTANFQPFGFINKFTPDRFISGLTPAGTFTQDLNIPLRQDSFALTAPPFGNYPGVVGNDGGLSVGLAFLSDIQVFMFMEAAQGDRRFNVMQAPKLTMFNGQSATLSVNDFQFFLTNVTPAFTASGQLYFIPQNQPVPLGVNVTFQPVISADRRFVRVNINTQLTNLANATVPVIPVQVPIPQVFEGGVVAPNQDRLFQIFLQQPTFTTINLNTTVSVPDGGTVLLGGLKTLSEGRLEYGPPILSKIPYIDRLFKNVGYGRDAQSLLMMITPRIIINEEEEIAQTGGPGGIPEAAP